MEGHIGGGRDSEGASWDRRQTGVFSSKGGSVRRDAGDCMGAWKVGWGNEEKKGQTVEITRSLHEDPRFVRKQHLEPEFGSRTGGSLELPRQSKGTMTRG